MEIDPIRFALFLFVLLLSVVVQEVAHAWQARREGDHTAEELGRITLNPIVHLDLWGSFLVPLILWQLQSGFLFGWAKPVPVQPANYRSPKWGDIRVSMAGIVSNLILTVLFTLLAAVVVAVLPVSGGLGSALFFVCEIGILLNLILAFFNLIPLPPLDGSHVLYHFLPRGWREPYRRFGQYGILALFGLFYFVPGIFGVVLWPVYFVRGLTDSFIRLWI